MALTVTRQTGPYISDGDELLSITLTYECDNKIYSDIFTHENLSTCCRYNFEYIYRIIRDRAEDNKFTMHECMNV